MYYTLFPLTTKEVQFFTHMAAGRKATKQCKNTGAKGSAGYASLQKVLEAMQAMRSHCYDCRGVQIHLYTAGTRNSPVRTVPNARISTGALSSLEDTPGKKEPMLPWVLT